MTASQPTTISTFTPWPESSPTSRYNINLRYYSTSDSDTGVTTQWDIGTEYERMLEQYYNDLQEVSHVSNVQTPKEYEEFIRTLLQNRVAFMVGTTLYPAIVSFMLGSGEDIFEDMVRQTDMLVTIHNRLAKKVGGEMRTNPLKPASFWKKLFA